MRVLGGGNSKGPTPWLEGKEESFSFEGVATCGLPAAGNMHKSKDVKLGGG